MIQLNDGWLKEVCFERFNKSVYSSTMLLGSCFQAGLLPFNLESLEKSIEKNVPASEVENNEMAFRMGREWFLNKKTQSRHIEKSLLLESDYEHPM